jgi:hypothetical protein
LYESKRRHPEFIRKYRKRIVFGVHCPLEGGEATPSERGKAKVEQRKTDTFKVI